jgi:hypothetical protein
MTDMHTVTLYLGGQSSHLEMDMIAVADWLSQPRLRQNSRGFRESAIPKFLEVQTLA